MRSYRIAMVMGCPFPAAQGTQVLVEQMSRALTSRGHDVHIVAYHYGDPNRSSDLPIHRTSNFPSYRRIRSGPDWRKPILDWSLTRTLLRVVKDHDIDVIHAHNYEAPLAAYVVRRKTGIPVIYHAHNMLGEELPTYFRTPWVRSGMRSLGHALDSYVPPRGNLCLALTSGIRDAMILRGACQEKTLCVPPAIESLPGNGHQPFPVPTAIYQGNLDGYQNLEFLLDAWKLVAAAVPKSRLVIVTHGDGSSFRGRLRRRRMPSRIDIMDRLTFSHSLEFLLRSQVAVNPRFGWWGFPIKLLNYMETGRAIVSCRGSAQGLRHLENAWIADNGDLEHFAEGIIELLSNPGLALQLGAAARNTAEDEFSWSQMVPRMEEAYERVIDGV